MTAGLTFILASLLAVASRWLQAPEDLRVGDVEQMLPHTNCGACSFPGSRAFAEALVGGKAAPVKCTVGAPVDHARIASFLGVNVGTEEKRVARLACAGGNNVARKRAHYVGLGSCAAVQPPRDSERGRKARAENTQWILCPDSEHHSVDDQEDCAPCKVQD